MLAIEQIQELREIEGVAGIHLMAIEWEERVPLSRVPPLNGTVELRESIAGLYPGAIRFSIQAWTRLALIRVLPISVSVPVTKQPRDIVVL